jgi:methyl-accepting chemotaxis protein
MPNSLATSYLAWRDEWTLEVGFMDEDHRQLAELLNRLARDCGTGPVPGLRPPGLQARSAPETLGALDTLAGEARLHFHREEALMRMHGYPDFDDHKADHDLLLAELSVLSRELADTRAGYLDAEVLETMKDWLLGHALGFDRRLADYLNFPDQPDPAPVSSD